MIFDPTSHVTCNKSDPTSHVTCNKREHKMRNCTFKKLKKCVSLKVVSHREKKCECVHFTSREREREKERDLSTSKKEREIET